MSHINQFRKELHKLIELRTAWLFKKMGQRVIGKPPKLSNKKIEQSIAKIQDNASKIFVNKISKYEFNKKKRIIKNHKIIGRGVRNKQDDIKRWYDTHIKSQYCVYMFFDNYNKCIYVGRTSNGKHRPASHCDKYWFKSVKRIKVIATQKADTPKIECMATHRYLPKYNIIAPSSSKWTKKCPICKVHSDIKTELISILK